MQVKVTGLDAARAAVGRVTFDRLAQPVAVAVAAEAQTWLATYPAVRRQRQPFTSDRQRRGFFARLRSGAIEVPYRRGSSPGSEQLGRRWRIIPQARGCLLVNTASYAALVQAEATQSAYHRGNWRTDVAAKAFIERDATAQRVADQAVRNALGV